MLDIDSCRKYLLDNRSYYLEESEAIRPVLSDWRALWSRTAFSILSANTHFSDAVDCLHAIEDARDSGNPLIIEEIKRFGMPASKASYINQLPHEPEPYLRLSTETWDQYRLRLKRQFKGLGLTKASFTACLIYPLTADVACLDTWCQRLIWGHPFKDIKYKQYVEGEEQIRAIGKEVGYPCCFTTQYALWEWSRKVKTNHRIFYS